MVKRICWLFFYTSLFQITFAQTKTAATVIAAAKAQVAKTDKKIFVKFSASWCTWCHKMQAALTDSTIAPIFNKYYVLTPLIVQENGVKKKLENAGAESLLKEWGGAEKGLPYWVVLDAEGTLIANSNNKKETVPLRADGDNVGCPAEDNEIAYFLRVLQKTSNITTGELAIIKERFKKINAK